MEACAFQLVLTYVLYYKRIWLVYVWSSYLKTILIFILCIGNLFFLAIGTPSTIIEPNQCDAIDYHILDDETRNLNYGNYEAYCDGDNDLCKSPDWKGSSWYRFDGPGGTRIPEKIAERYHCNTYAPGKVIHPKYFKYSHLGR